MMEVSANLNFKILIILLNNHELQCYKVINDRIPGMQWSNTNLFTTVHFPSTNALNFLSPNLLYGNHFTLFKILTSIRMTPSLYHCYSIVFPLSPSPPSLPVVSFLLKTSMHDLHLCCLEELYIPPNMFLYTLNLRDILDLFLLP